MKRYQGRHREHGRHRVVPAQRAAGPPLLAASGTVAAAALTAIVLSGQQDAPQDGLAGPSSEDPRPSLTAPGDARVLAAQADASLVGASLDRMSGLGNSWGTACPEGEPSECGPGTRALVALVAAVRATGAPLAGTRTPAVAAELPASARPAVPTAAVPPAGGPLRSPLPDLGSVLPAPVGIPVPGAPSTPVVGGTPDLAPLPGPVTGTGSGALTDLGTPSDARTLPDAGTLSDAGGSPRPVGPGLPGPVDVLYATGPVDVLDGTGPVVRPTPAPTVPSAPLPESPSRPADPVVDLLEPVPPPPAAPRVVEPVREVSEPVRESAEPVTTPVREDVAIEDVAIEETEPVRDEAVEPAAEAVGDTVDQVTEELPAPTGGGLLD